MSEKAPMQSTPFVSSTGETRNPIYEGQFDGETLEQAEARLHWAKVAMEMARNATLSAPSHSEQVLEGWQLVPVEPTDAMLEAGDKYIGTPATYKAMLSACPSPTITKDFSQFLSAVMDAAGLIRHGRQSKELSEYLGMKCMEYRGAARSAPSHGEQVREAVLEELLTRCADWCDKQPKQPWYGRTAGDMVRTFMVCQPLAAAPSAGSQERSE